jgi:hypothetical protein
MWSRGLSQQQLQVLLRVQFAKTKRVISKAKCICDPLPQDMQKRNTERLMREMRRMSGKKDVPIQATSKQEQSAALP